ncbi:hypothetical protein [Azospirillum soli]|uniref:hypothetical protein n=1 Tax=Azospirillum soli TaxID=1304799 RepID=UPI001AE4D9E6|nr:hypothetical protein [Azospirillum soli]MBP2315505.1 hypothetical protein [Azospirillum soli]
MAEVMAERTVGGIRIERYCTLHVAGDRHLVGRVLPGRWVVTGAVVVEEGDVLITHDARRYVLGEPAKALFPEAEAAARAVLKGLCCYDAEQIDAIVDRLRALVAG